MISRRQALVGGTAVAVAASMNPETASAAPGTVVLVERGEARSRVLVPATTTPALRHAAQTWVEYVARSTGVTLAIRHATEAPEESDLIDIAVGWSGPRASDGPGPDSLDIDGFLVDVSPRQVTIVGGSDAGTRFGVYDFVERHLGVRWLLPTELGEDVPTLPRVTVPLGRRIEEPAYLGRCFWPLTTALDVDSADWASPNPETVWADRNRMHNRSAMPANHTLFRIFPPAVHADPAKPGTYHPEFYPIIGGVRRLPAASSRSNWQPYFGSEATVRHAIDWVIDWFDAKPARPVVTLGINDGGQSFDDRDITPGLVNSVGMPSASEAFYGWLNAVVSGVLERRPDLVDKKFMTLAYNNVLDAPTFSLHPNVVPMVVRGLWTWADRSRSRRSREEMRRWVDCASEVGWYDYQYGEPMCLPRITLHAHAEAYRWGAANNARYAWAELVPSWSEGPKPWVCARLLWDPSQDPDALVREWCQRLVGPDAAPFLRKYVGLWERFWSTTIPGTDYFVQVSHTQGVGYDPAEYLAYVSEAEIATARELLDRCAERTTTATQRKRIELIRDLYRFPEASGVGYPKPVPALNPGTARLQLRDIRQNLDRRVAAAASRASILAEYDSSPLTKFDVKPNYGTEFSGFNGEAFWRLVDHVEAVPPASAARVRREIAAMATTGSTGAAARFASLLGAVLDDSAPSLLDDADFTDPDAAAWTLEAFRRVRTTKARSGGACARLDESSGRILQTFGWTGGLVAARAWFRCDVESPESIASVGLYLLDAGGAIRMRLTQPVRVYRTVGDYFWVGILEDIPSTTRGHQVAGVRLFVQAEHRAGASPLFVDDVQAWGEAR